jgi:hypothetical protein
MLGNWGDSMRVIAAIGFVALAAGCAPKLEFVDGARQPAPPVAQADQMEAAAAAQTAKPAMRVARSSALRAQTVGAHNQVKVDAQNNLTVADVRSQPNVVMPAATVATSGTWQRDSEVVTQTSRVDADDRAPGQAGDAAQEIALSPAREAALRPARETTALSPAREAASSAAQEAALSPAREAVPSLARGTALSPVRDEALSPAWETPLSPDRETALSPARETPLSPTRETAFSRAREAALSPAREAAAFSPARTALSPAREGAVNEGFAQANACIRSNLKAAYRSSDTVDQATSFLMRTCFATFSSAIASDEASAKTLFRGLVFQEISPVEWLEARQDGARPGGPPAGR